MPSDSRSHRPSQNANVKKEFINDSAQKSAEQQKKRRADILVSRDDESPERSSNNRRVGGFWDEPVKQEPADFFRPSDRNNHKGDHKGKVITDDRRSSSKNERNYDRRSSSRRQESSSHNEKRSSRKEPAKPSRDYDRDRRNSRAEEHKSSSRGESRRHSSSRHRDERTERSSSSRVEKDSKKSLDHENSQHDRKKSSFTERHSKKQRGVEFQQKQSKPAAVEEDDKQEDETEAPKEKKKSTYYATNQDDYAADWDQERMKERKQAEALLKSRKNKAPSESGETSSSTFSDETDEEQVHVNTNAEPGEPVDLDEEARQLIRQERQKTDKKYRTFKGKPDYEDKDRPDGNDYDLNEDEEQMIWAFQHGVFGKGKGFKGKIRGRGGRLSGGMGGGGRGRSRPSGGGGGGGRGRGGGSKWDFFNDPSKPFPFEGSGPNHILGKTKYFPGKYGFAAGLDSSDSDGENGGGPGGRGRGGRGGRGGGGRGRGGRGGGRGGGPTPYQLEQQGFKINKWGEVIGGENKNEEDKENGRESPNYEKGGLVEYDGSDDAGGEEQQQPWWNNMFDQKDEKEKDDEDDEMPAVRVKGEVDDVFNTPNEPGFKPLPRSKFHPSFEPASAVSRQINVNIRSKFDEPEEPEREEEPEETEKSSEPLNMDALRRKLRAEIMADLQKDIKKELKEDLQKSVTQETQKIQKQQQEYERTLHDKVVGTVMSGGATSSTTAPNDPAQAAQDDAQKEYLKSLKTWIEENAKDQEEAWEMFWDAYKQQQVANGSWSDDNAEHHQSVAYWWFGQAFSEEKENDKPSSSSVKQEPSKNPRQTLDQHNEPSPPKKIKQQYIEPEEPQQQQPPPPQQQTQPTKPKQPENRFSKKLSALSTLLRDVRKNKQPPAEVSQEERLPERVPERIPESRVPEQPRAAPPINQPAPMDKNTSYNVVGSLPDPSKLPPAPGAPPGAPPGLPHPSQLGHLPFPPNPHDPAAMLAHTQALQAIQQHMVLAAHQTPAIQPPQPLTRPIRPKQEYQANSYSQDEADLEEQRYIQEHRRQQTRERSPVRHSRGGRGGYDDDYHRQIREHQARQQRGGRRGEYRSSPRSGEKRNRDGDLFENLKKSGLIPDNR